MADYDTGRDILRNVVRRAGEILPTATDETTADRLIDVKLYINNAYPEVCGLKPWRWARKRIQFASIAEVEATVSSISTNVVTLTTTIATTMAGRKFLLDADGVPTRIASHAAGTNTLTLEPSAYTGTSTSGACTIFQDEIDTGATDLLAFPMIAELHLGDYIQIVPEGELIKSNPRNTWGWERARKAAFITATAVRLVPWTTSARLFELSYNRRPTSLTFDGTANDTPILPADARIAIAQRALVKLYADKRDERVEVVQKEFDETLARMSATEISFGKPRLRPGFGFNPAGY
jgi:hypothetical protein